MTLPVIKIKGIPPVFFILMVFILMAASRPGRAEEPAMPTQGPDNIHITADHLLADQNSQFVSFSGNVKALQGGTTIYSDLLKIYYQDAQNAPDTYSQNSIAQIIANGNVRIVFEDKTAYCEQAVYISENKTLTLWGENTRIESAGNFISGEKIIIYQLTGKIIVDGSEGKKVQAVFHPANEASIPDMR